MGNYKTMKEVVVALSIHVDDLSISLLIHVM